MRKKYPYKLFVLLLVLGGTYYGWSHFKGKKVQEKFRTVIVERGTVQIAINSMGTVQPQNRLEIKPPIQGRFDAIQAREGDRVKKGELLATMSSTERAAFLDAARTKGVKELSYWEEVYKPTPLVSPMEGIVIVRNVEPGQTVTQQDIPFVLSNRLILKAQVDETDIGQIKKGQLCEMVLDAYPQSKIPGMVNHIAYESKTVNNVTVYEVEVLPEKVPPFMRAGMTATLNFIVAEKNDVLILPEEAVIHKDDEARVLVSGEGGQRRNVRKVILGLSDGKKVEIMEGLSEGDQVFVRETSAWRNNNKERGKSPFMPFGGRRR